MKINAMFPHIYETRRFSAEFTDNSGNIKYQEFAGSGHDANVAQKIRTKLRKKGYRVFAILELLDGFTRSDTMAMPELESKKYVRLIWHNKKILQVVFANA